MSITAEQYKDLTRYLDNDMNVEEEKIFLEQLKNDVQLRDYYDFEVNLRDYGNVSDLGKNIPDFTMAQLAPTQKKVVPIRRWLMYVAAACIIGIVAFVAWFYPNGKQKQNVIVKNNHNLKENKTDTSRNVANNNIKYDTALKKINKPDNNNLRNIAIHNHKNIKRIPIDSNATLAVNGKQKILISHALKIKNTMLDSLKVPINQKTEENEIAIRGDIYGPDYSDIIIDNYTNYTIDIYVDGGYRGTIAPWDKRTTWAVPGNTKLYAKALFRDGTYYYWGPDIVLAGYEYTWQLHY